MFYRYLMLFMLLAGTASRAQPIDEFRLSDIEQNLRTLQSQVREQARQIAELQRQSGQRITPSNVPPRTDTSNERWLSLANWNRVKPGMTELQVIEVLGTPSAQRVANDNTRQMIYTLEIGSSGYLSGRVLCKDGKVSGIEIPSLK